MESMIGSNYLSISPIREKPDSISHLREGIGLLLSQWNALQMAVKNQWGGHDSLQKSHELSHDVFYWFFHSKGRLNVEDLENLLHETLLLNFNTEVEDGSIEKVAEQLMVMYEEHLHMH
ncbi:Pre-rRNA-processing protein TSR2 homolog [Linum perenne]